MSGATQPRSLLKTGGGVADSMSSRSGQAAGAWPPTSGTVMLAPSASGYSGARVGGLQGRRGRSSEAVPSKSELGAHWCQARVRT